MCLMLCFSDFSSIWFLSYQVISNLGLCISVYDIRSIDGGFIVPGDGSATYKVVGVMLNVL